MSINKLIRASIIGILVTNMALATGEHTVVSKQYTDDKFQTKIQPQSLSLTFGNNSVPLRSLIVYPDGHNNAAAGVVGQTSMIDGDTMYEFLENNYDNSTCSNSFDPDEPYCRAGEIFDAANNDLAGYIPTIDGVATYLDYWVGEMFQTKIKPAGYGIGPSYADDPTYYLEPSVAGVSIVTKIDAQHYSAELNVGERKIFEESDVPNYQDTHLTADEKSLQKISIPTMGAVMAAITNNSSTLIPAGTAGNIVTYTGTAGTLGSVATYNGSTTYNANTDANKIPTMAAVQRKKVCAEWPDETTTYDATHTDANCWLWLFPD